MKFWNGAYGRKSKWIGTGVLVFFFVGLFFLKSESFLVKKDGEHKDPPSEEFRVEEPVPVLLGTLIAEEGDQLERDLIGPIAEIFSVEEDEVKAQMALARTSFLISENTKDFRRMEGILVPGEYHVYEGETMEEWIARRISDAEERYEELSSRVIVKNTLQPFEHLILASLVEAECLQNEYYEETASVFLNRLEDDTMLQSCVTVEYAMGFQRPFLYGTDVKIESPYNTYAVKGLPAGTICSVDDESLLVAMEVSKLPDLYYFYYDYLEQEMYFFSDYRLFKNEANISRKVFEDNANLGLRDRINKQELFGAK